MANKLIVVALLFVAIVGLNAAEAPGSSPVGAPTTTPKAGAPSTTPEAGAPATTPEAASAPDVASTPASSPVSQAPYAESPEEELASPPISYSDSETDAPVLAPTPELAPTPSSDTMPTDDEASSAITVKISSALVAAAIVGFFSL